MLGFASKRVCLLLTAASACAGPARSPDPVAPSAPAAGLATPRTPRFSTLESMGEAMTWFYRDPNEALFADITLDLSAVEPELARKRHVADLLSVFIWRCVQRHGYAIPESATGQIVERAKLLLSEAPKADAEWVTAIREPGAMSPELLDVCWMSFFATGDPTHLDRILAATQGLSGKNVINVVTGTAKWSFKANCKQHPAVLAYAKKRRASPRNDEEAAFLDNCIQYAEKAAD